MTQTCCETESGQWAALGKVDQENLLEGTDGREWLSLSL